MIISPLFQQIELVCAREMDCPLQELSADPHYVIGAPMYATVCTSVPSVHNINSRTTTRNGPHPQVPEEVLAAGSAAAVRRG